MPLRLGRRRDQIGRFRVDGGLKLRCPRAVSQLPVQCGEGLRTVNPNGPVLRCYQIGRLRLVRPSSPLPPSNHQQLLFHAIPPEWLLGVTRILHHSPNEVLSGPPAALKRLSLLGRLIEREMSKRDGTLFGERIELE